VSVGTIEVEMRLFTWAIASAICSDDGSILGATPCVPADVAGWVALVAECDADPHAAPARSSRLLTAAERTQPLRTGSATFLLVNTGAPFDRPKRPSSRFFSLY
jgi:hypothetical protein